MRIILSKELFLLKILLTIISLIILFTVSYSYAAKITLALNPNSTTEPAGYKLYYGLKSRSEAPYTGSKDLGHRLRDVQFDIQLDLLPNTEYYFAATAYDTSGNESSFSAEVSKIVPPSGQLPPEPTNIRIILTAP